MSTHTAAADRKGSRFAGVYWDPGRQKWRATLGTGGQYRNLGRFDSEVDAARAYDDAAREALGDFARLNFPTPAERERAAAFVDRHEARRMFEISLPAWKRWEQAGLIRGIKTSYRVFYRVADLERLLPELGPIEPPYPDPDRPGVYRVPLTGRGPYRRRGEAIIDAESLPLVAGRRFCWSATGGPGGGYVALSCVIGGEPREGGTTPLHRLIIGINDPDLQIGHANGDSLDCRRKNLIVRTIQQRLWSSQKRRTANGEDCTSRFKGVSWIRREQKWRARIKIDGKETYLGRFLDEVDAAYAYDEAAREHFGEHAWLNFPDARKGERGMAEDASESSRAAA
jgi:hypothetical protein